VDLGEVDEAVDAVVEALHPDEASSGSISIATSSRKATSSPMSLATRSMVLTR
jgi:hypothetical protein